MTMTPSQRKIALTGHVTASVGWLGAVVVFLALSVVGLTSGDGQTVRSSYIAMEAIGWIVLVPLSLASLLTGLLQSLGTRWGLLRHYWVLAKLLMNVFATVVLLMYTQTLAHLGDLASDPALSDADLLARRNPSPVLHAAGALVLLAVATILSVFKPQGLTRFGRRRRAESKPVYSQV